MANCTNADAVSDGCYTLWTMIFTAVSISLVITVIITGNALVILAVLKDRRLKQQLQNWLIVSLAIADLLVGFLVTPLTLVYEVSGSWQFGDILCELWLALDVLFVTASILNLCAISLDRYWCVTDPVCYPSKRTPRRMMTTILIVWILAFAISFPPLVGWRTIRRPGECTVSNDMSYVLYSASGSFFIPVAIILAVYAKIYSVSRERAVRKSRAEKQKKILLTQSSMIVGDYFSATTNNINNSSMVIAPTKRQRAKYFSRSKTKSGDLAIPNKDSDQSPTDNNYQKIYNTNGYIIDESPPKSIVIDDQASVVLSQNHVQQQMIWRRKIQKRRERHATLILGLILAAFIVCWMPFFLIYVLGAICCETPELVFDIFFWLGYCNSGLNPVIYNYLNPDYRRAFRKILTFKKFN